MASTQHRNAARGTIKKAAAAAKKRGPSRTCRSRAAGLWGNRRRGWHSRNASARLERLVLPRRIQAARCAEGLGWFVSPIIAFSSSAFFAAIPI